MQGGWLPTYPANNYNLAMVWILPNNPQTAHVNLKSVT